MTNNKTEYIDKIIKAYFPKAIKKKECAYLTYIIPLNNDPFGHHYYIYISGFKIRNISKVRYDFT